ncbi:MAG: hypothetical protein EOP19_10010, partial [Hyphomicrobiales bacterium]
QIRQRFDAMLAAGALAEAEAFAEIPGALAGTASKAIGVAELARRDPETAGRLRPGDPQRILRALEILSVTGEPLAALQRGAGAPLIDAGSALTILLTPPRPLLRDQIRQRFDAMLAAGALAEAEAFAKTPGALAGTAGKAIGVAELVEHLAGRLDLDTARDRAVTRSRQYAKRQETWFRHQFDGGRLQPTEQLDADIGKVLQNFKFSKPSGS